MLFGEIPGQELAKKRVAEMIDSGRLPHALLFLGPPGSGKLALAFAAAQRLLCSRREEGAPCALPSLSDDPDLSSACPGCRKSARAIHPDLHFSFPTVGSKATSDAFLNSWREALTDNPWMNLFAWLQTINAENQQGNITREECQHIMRKLSLKPFEAAYKVLIMWMPELLGKEGNRLLKMVEEPPEDTFFLFVAEEPERILPTLLSRCQLLQLTPLSDEEVADGLRRRFPAIGPRAESIAFQAQGDFDQALRLAQERQEDDDSPSFIAWLRLCYQGSALEIVPWTEKFARQGREAQKYFLQFGLQFLREVLLLKAVGPDQVRLANEDLETAQKLGAYIDLEQAEALSQIFTQAIEAVERNANPKILFLDVSIKVHRVMTNKPAAAAG